MKEYLLFLHRIFNPLPAEKLKLLPSSPIFDPDYFIKRGFSARRSEKVADRSLYEKTVEALREAERQGWKVLLFNQESYPELLLHTSHPPLALFVWGEPEILSRPSVAIVGTRRASEYGRKYAKEFAAALAEAGLVVVSGLAAGIDTWAHRGALEKGKTVAVLGSGLKRIYPSFNRSLAAEIALSGAVITEFFPDDPPEKYHFPLRNRIIAGLCRATLVIEAGRKSGALITARFAVDYGRDVMALPGPVGKATSEGCNLLIQQGAKLVMGVEDVLEEYSLLPFQKPERKKISEEEEFLLKFIPFDRSVDVESLSEATGLGADRLFPLLLGLEMKGLVEQISGWRYIRRDG